VDSFEWNKIAGAVLVGLLLFMGVTMLSESIFEGEEEILIGSGEEAVTAEAPMEETVVAEGPSFGQLLVQAAANPSDRSFNKCKTCHTANEGGGNRIGPNLYGVVGSIPGSKDYAYSSAITSKGGTWDYAALDAFLTSPGSAVPGTKMTFAGVGKAEERAAIIAYLRSQSSDPFPLPEAAAE